MGVYSKELKAGSHRDLCTPIFTAALLTIAKKGKQPKCPRTGEWIGKCNVSCQGVLVSLEKEGDSDIFCNVNDP